MLKALLVVIFIVSVIFLVRSFVFLVRARKSGDESGNEKRVVSNLGARVFFSVFLIMLTIVLLATGILEPNNPLATSIAS